MLSPVKVGSPNLCLIPTLTECSHTLVPATLLLSMLHTGAILEVHWPRVLQRLGGPRSPCSSSGTQSYGTHDERGQA